MDLFLFLSGAVAFGFLVCAVFFLRFWSRTRDQLFIWFAVAFALLGAGQAWLALTDIPKEERGPIFLIRLMAFGLILWAVIRKNRTEA